jgi:hypothetical protein
MLSDCLLFVPIRFEADLGSRIEWNFICFRSLTFWILWQSRDYFSSWQWRWRFPQDSHSNPRWKIYR